jgi:hypothetical protein
MQRGGPVGPPLLHFNTDSNYFAIYCNAELAFVGAEPLRV